MAANRIILDSGALSLLAEEKGRIRQAISEAISAGATVVVPTVVLVETTTGHGPRDATVNRVVSACTVVDLDERIARDAAALRYRLPACGVADAIVMATADLAAGSHILTGDANDMLRLSSIRGRTTVIAF